MKQNNLFELLDYIKKKNGNNELRSIYGNMDKTLSITNFQTTYYMRSYHQTRKQRSHFEIILNESLDGNLNIAIYHLAENKVERTIDFYKGKITESTINKIENELRDFFFILLLDKDIVEKIISKSKIGKRTTTLPIIQVSVNIGNKKLNSFIINWLNEVFDSNREEMDNHIDSFDIFKNENLIETYITKPKDLINLIKENPDWKEYLELTYAV
jgi:hypothetical protein